MMENQNHYFDKNESQGANANKNGEKFENTVYRICYHGLKLNYDVVGYDYDSRRNIYKHCEIFEKYTHKLIAVFACQHSFNSEFCHMCGFDYVDIGFKKYPDGFIYFPNTGRTIVFEIKNQDENGSVEDKLGAADFLRYIYSKIIGVTEDKIEFKYICSDNYKELFNEDKLSNLLDYWTSRNIDYCFGYKFPLEFLGLEETVKTPEDVINKIIEEEYQQKNIKKKDLDDPGENALF